mgnify:CR=1 FL=1
MSIEGNHEYRYEDAFIKAQFEISRLKAEVEELKSQPDPLTAYLYAAELAKDDIKKLKDEVKRLTWLQVETLNERNKAEAHIERLTKAGDAMASIIKYEPGVNTFDPIPNVVKCWLAAKEGKQQ